MSLFTLALRTLLDRADNIEKERPIAAKLLRGSIEHYNAEMRRINGR